MIREAKLSDAARIAEIEVMSCRYAYKDIVPYDCLFKDMTVEGRTLSVERWINEKLFGIYVNEDPDTGVIKGMMGIGMNEDDDKDNAFELHFIYVDPDYMRSGAGTEMLDLFELKGREKGCTEFASDCELDNADSFGFHISLGFEEVNRIICFRKDL